MASILKLTLLRFKICTEGDCIKKVIKSLLKDIDGKPTVSTKGLKSLSLNHPFIKPNKTILSSLSSIVSSEKYTTFFAFKSLLPELFTPSDCIYTTAGSTAFFF